MRDAPRRRRTSRYQRPPEPEAPRLEEQSVDLDEEDAPFVYPASYGYAEYGPEGSDPSPPKRQGHLLRKLVLVLLILAVLGAGGFLLWRFVLSPAGEPEPTPEGAGPLTLTVGGVGKGEETLPPVVQPTDLPEIPVEQWVYDPSGQAQSQSALMQYLVEALDVVGENGEIFGSRGLVHIPRDAFEAAAPQDFTTFVDARMLSGGYNWFTIALGDSKGLVFANSAPETAAYGTLDEEGRVSAVEGYYVRGQDGLYRYEPV